jgi:uncharacterized membrane protein
MKLFGHPLHLMFIHFPSALFPMECVCYGCLYYSGNVSFASASYYALVGGVLLGWLAVVFGTIDLMKIPSGKTEALTKALVHGSINTTVVIMYTVLAWLLFLKYPALPKANGFLFCMKISLITFMIVGNYFGAQLVLKHKLGLE